MPTILFALLLAAQPSATDTVVVCPQAFRQALEPWLVHREAQGHRIALVSNLQSAAAIRGQIRQVAAAGGLRTVVLVGDADPELVRSEELRRVSVPTHHVEAVVNARFAPEKEIASDNWYADLDDDRVPEVAVGRLTADTPAELSQMVRKILNYEKSIDFGAWRRQVHFVAGIGGFGSVADAMLEATAKSLIREGVPPAYATTMTYGSWQSPYCPDPRLFNRVTVERLDEGCLFWVYLGHGQQRMLDRVRVPGAAYPILAGPDVERLSCRHAAPIACVLACYSGAFDQPRDCLAEEMLRSSGGPVAILSSSRVAMPYGMCVLGAELMQVCFTDRAATIGEALLAAKRRTMRTDELSTQRQALDAAAALLGPSGDALTAERAEHLDLFNLLGDPLLRLPYPLAFGVEAAKTATAGTVLEVRGTAPLAGDVTVELAPRRDRTIAPAPRREQFDPAALPDYTDVYRQANQPCYVAQSLRVAGGPFHARLEVPADVRGACHVRVFVQGADGCAAGAADVEVRPPLTARK